MNAQELARWLSAEHETVTKLMTDLGDRVALTPRTNHQKWIEEVRQSFGHLRAHMIKHIALKEQGGYMVPVVQRRPAFSREVARLAHEHAEMVRIMDGIHQTLEAVQPEDQLIIRDICHRVMGLLSYLEHHENAENLLVFSAFTDDIGGRG